MGARKTKSRAATEAKETSDVEAEKYSHGIDRKDIVVMSDSGRFTSHGDYHDIPKNDPESSGSSEQENMEMFPRLSQEDPSPLHRNITFADNLVSPTGRKIPDDPMSSQGSSEQHNTILERQRNQNDSEILRIPGPRESDRGQNPEDIRHEESMSPDGLNADRHIRVDTSNSAARYRARTFSQSRPFRQSATQGSQVSSTVANRNTSSAPHGTPGLPHLPDFRSLFTRHDTANSKATVAPYLSWQPTIGRNSAFIDLTEDQREELGGIEYRSLKLLAAILIGKIPLYNRLV